MDALDHGIEVTKGEILIIHEKRLDYSLRTK